MGKPNLQEKIAQLRATFVEQLPQRMEEIDALYQRLLRDGEDQEALRELHRLLHSIKGTSASFGLQEINRIAASAESEAKQLMTEGWPGRVLLERELGRFLASLHHVIHGAGAKPHKSHKGLGFELPDTAGADDHHPPLVYICDDDPLHAEQLASQIQCFGYQTRVFCDTETLRSTIHEKLPDVLLLDIIFPDNPDGGLKILETLQREVSEPLPGIFLSSRVDFQARLRAIQAGGSAYFSKPVRVLELVDTLDEITHRQEPEPYRVMVIDDEPAVSQYHALILEDAGIETLVVNEPEKVLDLICEFNPDLVLMDMYMPLCSGQELAAVIRQIPKFISLPIVYLSSETDEAKQFSALRVGADGFLTKPIDAERLIADVSVRAERMRTLRALMLRDSLTGLYNHTTIKQFLDNAVLANERQRQPLSFVMIDVDHFKSVNDRFGHPAGDQVLLALSRLLQQRLRQSDLIGRYGGEEFAVILNGADAGQAHEIVDSLRKDFARISFHAEPTAFTCTFSAGVATFPEYGDSSALCEAADRALYTAKAAGRNRVRSNGEEPA